jgi:hypothetical protein
MAASTPSTAPDIKVGVMAILLGNGVLLMVRQMRHKGTGSRISKLSAGTAFNGDAEVVKCECKECQGALDLPRWRCAVYFSVNRNTDGTIDIGCVTFTRRQVAQVRRWLRAK